MTFDFSILCAETTCDASAILVILVFYYYFGIILLYLVGQ